MQAHHMHSSREKNFININGNQVLQILVHMQHFLEIIFPSLFSGGRISSYTGVNSEVWVTLVGKGSSANTALESSLIFL